MALQHTHLRTLRQDCKGGYEWLVVLRDEEMTIVALSSPVLKFAGAKKVLLQKKRGGSLESDARSGR